jgi:hypothetical protein
MSKRVIGPRVQGLLDGLDEAFNRRSWHGPNLRGSLRGMTPAHAAWRPSPRRHNAWEIAIHAAYWKYVVRRMITGGPRGSFLMEGSNWFARPEAGRRADARAWASDVRLLVAEHAALREAVARLKDADLDRRPSGSSYTRGFLIRGAAAHDLYHAGQIQLLKKLHHP